MKLALISTDNRECFKRYDEAYPIVPPPQEALLTGFEQIPGLEVHFISCLQVEPIHSPLKLAPNIYYHGLHVPKLGWMRTGYQGCIRAVRRLLQELKPDIVHGQGTERDCAMCAVFSGVPNVLTIHGNMRLVANFLRSRPLSYYWIASCLERLCLKKTDGVVAISSYTERAVKPFARKTWLLPNPVHPSYFKVTPIPGKRPIIFCAATIGERKNQLGLIRALEPLRAHLDFEVRFAGAGQPDDPYFQEFDSTLSHSSWCTYLGSLNRQELQHQLAGACLAILPSFEDNCPMVILEAAAAGVPVAASLVGGIPDLIRHEHTGLLFNPHSSGQIKEAIERILSDKPVAIRLSANARAEATTRFDPRVVAEGHLKIYHEVLNRL